MYALLSFPSNCCKIVELAMSLFVTLLNRQSTKPTHYSQRVRDVVPGVVVWSLCVYSHGWVGKCSEILAA